MTYLIKKINVAITLLLITSLGYAYGDYNNAPAYDDCGNCCSCEPSCGHGFIGAEVLYLRAFEEGLSSACDRTDITNFYDGDTVVSTLRGKTHDPDFQWNVGFRIGAGYEFANSNCGIAACWTHFNSNTHGNHGHNHEHHWKIDFDAVDVIFGYEYKGTDCFGVTPYIGVKYANINQKLRTNFISTIRDGSGSFSDSSFSDSTSQAGSRDRGHVTSSGDSKDDFWGVGPLFGLEADWLVGCGLGFYGNVSIATLYGNFHGKSLHTDLFETGTNINHLNRHRQACQFVLDAGIGITWRTCFCGDNYLVLQLGLEEHRYFNQNQFCCGDLSLDGVSFGAGIEF